MTIKRRSAQEQRIMNKKAKTPPKENAIINLRKNAMQSSSSGRRPQKPPPLVSHVSPDPLTITTARLFLFRSTNGPVLGTPPINQPPTTSFIAIAIKKNSSNHKKPRILQTNGRKGREHWCTVRDRCPMRSHLSYCVPPSSTICRNPNRPHPIISIAIVS